MLKKTGWRLAGRLFRPAAWEKKFQFFFGVTPRSAGNMRDPGALGKALSAQGWEPRAWAGGRQVHGARIRTVRRPTAAEAPATDGLVTDRPGIVLRVLAADCVPVIAVDPERRVLGAFHAGWRGTEMEILRRGLRLMRRRYGSRMEDVWIFFGPHIQKCCYAVGPEVADRFKNIPGAVEKKGAALHLNLARCLAGQAKKAGVPAGRILDAPSCTCHDRRFHSYRRDKTDKRMAALAALRE